MNQKIFFSIIIPTFNSGKTLEKCLESVVNQSFKDFEVLIMDGLSTDNTLEIAKLLNDNRIKIFSEKDKGVYDAMNKGIDKASGEWLYFLGSDDELYENDVLKKIHNKISNGNYDFVYGNVFYIHKKTVYDGEFSRLKLMTKRNICHQAIFYNKELFKRLGKYNLDFNILADYDFNIRCFSYPEIKILYKKITIANYDDIAGISSNKKDRAFYELVPKYHIENYERKINALNQQINKLSNPLEYTARNFLKRSFKVVKQFCIK